MSTSVQLCLDWAWFSFQRLLIIVLGIGAYGSKPPAALIASTQKVFSRRLSRPVTEQEALEIIRAFSNFVTVLKEVRHEPAK